MTSKLPRKWHFSETFGVIPFKEFKFLALFWENKSMMSHLKSEVNR